MIEGDPKAEGEMPTSEGDIQDAEPDAKSPRAKSPWKAFVLTGLFAALIGAAGGGAGIYVGLKTVSPDPVVQSATDLAPLEAKLDQLTARLKTAEAELQEVANRPIPEFEAPEFEVPEFEAVDLTPLEDRLQALETAPRPDIDPEALSALQSAQSDGFEWPDVSKLEARLAALETEAKAPSDAMLSEAQLERITALENRVETVQTTLSEARPSGDVNAGEIISALEARISALETRPAPQSVVERVSLLAFPKARMIQAVESNRAGGIIEKTFSRHVQVKNANDPLTLIDGIESDVSEGRLAPAIEKFERLPEPIRSAGQAWYESVKASL